MILRFDRFSIDTECYELHCDQQLRPVEPMVFDLIVHLATNPEQVFSRDQLIETVWKGRIVSDATIASCIKNARKALDDAGDSQKYIKTVRGRGFRFSASVSVTSSTTVEQSADDLVQPLLECSKTALAAGKPSIAVLPLQMHSLDPNVAFLADALSHELIVELSRLHWLHVIARGSSFQFRQPHFDVDEVSRVLGVRYILAGSLALFGKKNIVTLELCDATDASVVWADSIECSQDDLLEIRHAITARIVRMIEVRIESHEAQRAASLSTENLDAWAAYHRGLWHMFQFTSQDSNTAVMMFNRAIEEDPSFARAYAGLSFIYFQRAFVRGKDRSMQSHLAKTAAERAYLLDPLDPFINLTMGRATLLLGDWEQAERWFNRSIDLNPNYAYAFYQHSLTDAVVGNGVAGPQYSDQALTLSPIDPMRSFMLGARALCYIVNGDYEAARRWGEAAAAEPNSHEIIWTFAALGAELAGAETNAKHWVARIHSAAPEFGQSQFLQSLPIHDSNARATIMASMTRLGL